MSERNEYYEFLASRGVNLSSISEGQVPGFVERLSALELVKNVPREQLEWLVRESQMAIIEKGILLTHPGEVFEHLIVILEGEFEGYLYQHNQKKVQSTSGLGAFTGQMPFSRMKTTPIYVEIVSPMVALFLHKSRFRELVSQNYELIEAIVHAMTDRVRHFSVMHFQNEKLMSLGKLSAGITHELNNPAAAIVRSAEDLKQTIGAIVENLKSITSLELTSEIIDALLPILQRAQMQPQRLSLLERKRLEDDLTDWLVDRDLPADYAETFLSFGLKISDLDRMQTIVPEHSFAPFLHWLVLHLRIERSADEIATSSRRISELVQSVKSYTRMDQVQDMQELCINDGIENTMTMLQHKIRKNSINASVELAAGLPKIKGFPGELNQVWTNIIDNALDAMKNGGELTVQTFSEPERVIFSVVDNGPGISPENVERIFDPFFTTKDVGEGTGVGLDVVQKVVSLHKGKVEVHSKPGRTEFRVVFPQIDGTL